MASKYKLKNGETRWRAHWRDDTGTLRSKTWLDKDAAEEWERKMKREAEEQLLGRNSVRRSTDLDSWIKEWWARYIKSRPLGTRESYAYSVNSYISPTIGGLKMSELRPERVAKFRDDLLDDGVPPGTVGAALRVLSSCLGKAVERGLLDSNPARDVHKPAGNRSTEKWPLAPEEIELLRQAFFEYRGAKSGPVDAFRSATMVSLMAYGGLRPEEVVGSKVKAILHDQEHPMFSVEDVFSVEHRMGATKTYVLRDVDLAQPLYEDLVQWLDILPRIYGRPIRQNDWLFPDQNGSVTRATHKNWANRPWGRAKAAVIQAHPELADTTGRATPYTLRGSFVSLMARAGHSEADIAMQAGHSVKVLQRYYLRSIKRLRRMKPLPEGEQIELARQKIGTPAVASLLHRELAGPKKGRRLRLVEPNAAEL